MTAKRYLKSMRWNNMLFVWFSTHFSRWCVFFLFLKWSQYNLVAEWVLHNCTASSNNTFDPLWLDHWWRCFPKGLDLWFALQHESSWIRCSHGGCGFARATPSWVSLSTGPQMRPWRLGVESLRNIRDKIQQRERTATSTSSLPWESIRFNRNDVVVHDFGRRESHLKQYSCLWINGDSQCQSELDLFVFASPLKADWKTATMISRSRFVRGLKVEDGFRIYIGIHRKNEKSNDFRLPVIR